MNYDSIPTIIFGSSGGAKDVYYWIKQSNLRPEENGILYDVIGFIERDINLIDAVIFDNQRIIASDDNINEIVTKYEKVAAILPFGFPKIKHQIYNKLINYDNIVFPSIIHPSVIYDKSAGTIGEGNILGPGSIIASEYSIGNFNYISLNCTLGHDINIGDFNSINPMATISGDVNIGNYNLIGAGAIVLQRISLGDNLTVGAGAVVTKDLKGSITVVGIPARELIKDV